jgi:hypothetical protein
MNDDLVVVEPFISRHDQWFDQSLYAKGDALKKLVNSVSGYLQHHSDERGRQRAWKAKDQRTFRACIEAVTVNLAYLIVRPSETGRLALPRATGTKRDRYDNPHLGPVDGFDDDQAECKGHDGAEVSRRLLAAERNALEAFELADRLLDAGAGAIERLRKESRPVLLIGLVRNHRGDATLARRRTVALSGVSLVAHRGTRRDVRSKIKQGLELRAVARLTAREVEGQRQAIEVDLEVDLGREAAA